MTLGQFNAATRLLDEERFFAPVRAAEAREVAREDEAFSASAALLRRQEG
jgi:hypothetical protein